MLKKLLIILVIVGVLGGGYYFFVVQKQGATGTSSLLSTSNGVTQTVNPAATTDISAISDTGQEFLSSLLSLRKMSLNDGVFTDPAFKSLQDFTRPLVPLGNEGRVNPFSPIGSDPSISVGLLSATNAGTATTQTQAPVDTTNLLNQLLNQNNTQ
ncbi:hypothetical protein IT403_00375 [Candidatus Nomurabacteria bacterium]|nr:hypothetical protein [Candidatus Nomurabacteria bacterium]